MFRRDSRGHIAEVGGPERYPIKLESRREQVEIESSCFERDAIRVANKTLRSGECESLDGAGVREAKHRAAQCDETQDTSRTYAANCRQNVHVGEYRFQNCYT